MRYLFSNDFWALEHPLVLEVKNGLSPEKFLNKISDDDPFVIVRTPDRHNNTQIVYIDVLDAEEKARRVARFPTEAVNSAKHSMLLTKEELTDNEEIIRKLFPSTIDTYDKLKQANTTCTECAANEIRAKIIQHITQTPMTRGQLTALVGKIKDISIRLLCREPITDAELLTYTPRPAILNAKDYSKRKRAIFFDTPACGRGENRDNCKLCRLDAKHRLMISQEYTLPNVVTVDIDGYTLTRIVIDGKFSAESFRCPYSEKLRELQPSWLTAVSNALKAGSRVARAILNGKHVQLPPHEVSIREAICLGTAQTPKCEFLSLNELRCSECACYISLKAPLKTEDCPLNKWPKRK